MKKILAISVVLLIILSVYLFFVQSKTIKSQQEKQEAITIKKHSTAFNESVDRLMAAYFSTKDAFVETDSVKAKICIQNFIRLLDSIPLSELDKDSFVISQTIKSTIEDLKANAVSLTQQTNITEMRQDFRTISDMLYPAFFKLINYEGPKLFLQNCPMAFDGDKDANWISNSEEIINPYLGKHHPLFKGTMLNCGETKDSITQSK
jgi:hypothetical protein